MADGGTTEPQELDRDAAAVPSANDAASRVAAFVDCGGRAVVVLCPSRALRAAVLEKVLAALPGHHIRAGNPLAGPLTLHRLMFQVGAGAADEDDALLARRLAERVGTAALAVLAVDDGHTLAPDALLAVAQVPSPATVDQPGRLLILAGHPDLLLKLFGRGLEALNDPANALMVDVDVEDEGGEDEGAKEDGGEGASGAAVRDSQVGEGTAALAAAGAAGPGDAPLMVPPAALAGGRAASPPSGALGGAADAAPPLPERPAAGRSTAWRRLAVPALAVLGGAASLLVALTLDKPPVTVAGVARPGPAALPGPAAEPAATAPPVPQMPDAAAPVTAAPGADARPGVPAPRRAALASDGDLRREFDAFLDRAGQDTASLSLADRAALFREYLDWRGKGGRVPPP